MRRRFLTYLILEVVVIFAVMGFFRFIQDRQIAATFAGSLFVGVPLVLMIAEYRAEKLKNWVWFLCAAQFWVLFALPILGMRLLNWGVEFDSLSFLGISGPQMHAWSSKSYMLMVIATAWFWIKSLLKKA